VEYGEEVTPMRTARWLVPLALGMLAGCAPQEPPPEPVETLVVYSLEPMGSEIDGVEPGDVFFHHKLVYGSVTVTDPQAQQEILNAVRQGIEEEEQDPTVHKMCMFMPRHGVRHTAKDGRVTEWVICFSCGDVRIWENGQPQEWVKQHSIGGMKTNVWNTTRHAQKLLNNTLRAAGVELASGADKGE